MVSSARMQAALTLDGDALIGALLGDRYRVLRCIGEGGMARVYEARHTMINRIVAIKVLLPHVAAERVFVERFLQEGRAAGTLGHPHIVESTDMGLAPDGRPFLVYELLRGISLWTLVERGGRQRAARVVRLAGQIASEIGRAHV